MRHIGFLVADSHAKSAEEGHAWSFLRRMRGFSSQRVTFAALARKAELLDELDVLWWHYDQSLTLPPRSLQPECVDVIRNFVQNGKGLLLSLLAAQYIRNLGFEQTPPNVVQIGEWKERSWADGYPDIRGFAGYGNHPIFEGFLGGLYTWTTGVGKQYSSCYYEDALPLQGKVLGVEKLYIKLNEARRIVVEYDVGKGGILTVGTHLFFGHPENRFRSHLEQFATNCLGYLSEPPRRRRASAGSGRNYWSFSSPPPKPVKHTAGRAIFGAVRLPKETSGIEIHRDCSSPDYEEQFFDVSGRRLLVMGKERSGIAEVWSHPTRILRDLNVGFKVGDHPLAWASQCPFTITIRPESITRRFQLPDAAIEETLFVDHRVSAGAVTYRIKSTLPVQVIVTGSVDLRRMWPLSDKATGSLDCAWDPSLRALVTTDPWNTNVSILGSPARDVDHLAGHFSEISLEHDQLVGIPLATSIVRVAMKITVESRASHCAFIFAGSGFGRPEALRSYLRVASNISGTLRKQALHYRRLLSRTLDVITPTVQLNKSYQWSIVSTDRLFAETRGLGASFLAGYGLSTSGWDGGQAISGRPGYAWYFGRDSIWMSFAALKCGECDKVKSVLTFLGRHQDLSGKILHELTTSGYCHYDAADATPLYIVLFGRYLRATGDAAFARQEFARLKKALAYAFSTDTDGDHLIENTDAGHGWIEGGKLFPVHTEHYLASCWYEALNEASFVCDLMRDKRFARMLHKKAVQVGNILRKRFRNEVSGFYDFAINSDGTHRTEKTILPTVGMYFGCADRSFAQRSLAAIAGDEFSADWGVRIIGKKDPLYGPRGYHYGSIWPLFTGWTSLAEFRQGRPLQGYSHLLSNAALFDRFAAGCIEEVLHGEQFEPAGVCPHQGWSSSMVTLVFIDGMLGLDIDARRNSLSMRPYLPPDWNRMLARNIQLGTAAVSMTVERNREETVFTYKYSVGRSRRRPQPSVCLQPYFPLGTIVQSVWINGSRLHGRFEISEHADVPVLKFELTKNVEIRYRHLSGISIIPVIPHLRKGNRSEGIRIIEEEWSSGNYIVTVEGRSGEEYLLDFADPSHRVRQVEGAILLAEVDGRLTISVRFPGLDAATHVQTTIVLLA